MPTDIIGLIIVLVCVAGLDFFIARMLSLIKRNVRGTLYIEETDEPEPRQSLTFKLDINFEELAEYEYIVFKVNNKCINKEGARK